MTEIDCVVKMGTRLTKKAKEIFESIKTVDENGIEWWSSRELAKTRSIISLESPK